MMNPNKCCPFCSSPTDTCPHLLIAMGAPGEVLDGALAERLTRLWQIIVQNVGDDPRLDPHQVYEQTWKDLLRRYGLEGGVTLEGDRWGAIFLPDPACMEAVVEACIPQDEL